MTFEEHMHRTLGGDYGPWLAAQEKPPLRGIRANLLKVTPGRLRELLGEPLGETPFCGSGFVLEPQSALGGSHPLHHAGAFYFQEPSAMSAVTALDPQPGDAVLDLCAAPGGKSTQIAAALKGRGLLWSNEIVRGRAKILLSNLERMGVHNAVVSSAHPEPLCRELKGFFDKVLADAPCSGEGMMRREPEIRKTWSYENVKACAARQLKLLDSAAEAVKTGGVLVYSTCTFAGEENEQVIAAFLETHPDFQLEEIPHSFGRSAYERLAPGCAGITRARRILPQDGGEGHFVARMRRKSENMWCGAYFTPTGLTASEQSIYEECCRSFLKELPEGAPHRQGEDVLLLPSGIPAGKGLGILRAGVLAGTLRGGKRFEPAHALFQSLNPEQMRAALDMDMESPELLRFLRGEELPFDSGRGYIPVTVNGIPLGFGKASGGRLKNHYPKGLRNFG